MPGFVNVEQADFPHVHHKTSIDRLPMFADGTVDLIYCSHAFEYFDRQEGARALREWQRVLKTGATLRLAVPDFEALVKVYELYGDLGKLLGPLFGRMEVFTPESKVIYHKTVYDFRSLQVMLEAEGFINVRRYDWRETIHRDYDDHSQAYVPHMDKENGMLTSLNVEADKA